MQLPTVRDMALQLGINANTVSRIYSDLEREGYLLTPEQRQSLLDEQTTGFVGGLFQLTPTAIGTHHFPSVESYVDYMTLKQGYANKLEPELATPDHTVRFFAGGRLLAEQPAQWVKWERSEDYNVIVPLPVEPSRIEALSWHEPGRSGAIDRSSLEAMGLLAP